MRSIAKGENYTMRKHKFLVAYLLALTVFTSYVIMDTFVIARVYGDADAAGADMTEIAHDDGSYLDPDTYPDSGYSTNKHDPVITADSYDDGNISIKLSEYTVDNTEVYMAEVKPASAGYLKTAFAYDAYGRNVTQPTSEIADNVNAILAINGDFYGTQERGYVIRNGVLYRSEGSADREDLVIYADGSFEIISESEVSAEQLIAAGAVQTLSFGPALVEDGEVSVGLYDEVGRAMASNPRTAIGIRADGTYLFVVSDGRTEESEGLSLYELADFMQSMGAVTAYNLDGGGSSTMVFNGIVVNDPTGGHAGHGTGSERSVSDIVYIGY